MIIRDECDDCGCQEKLSSTEKNVCRLSTKLEANESMVYGMIMRLTVMLGNLAVSIILLAVNLDVK